MSKIIKITCSLLNFRDILSLHVYRTYIIYTLFYSLHVRFVTCMPFPPQHIRAVQSVRTRVDVSPWAALISVCVPKVTRDSTANSLTMHVYPGRVRTGARVYLAQPCWLTTHVSVHQVRKYWVQVCKFLCKETYTL